MELFAGRMSLPDQFDQNDIGSDSHLQFLNWTTDNNGAWDYAANTRGYTDAVIAEYVDDPRGVTLRYGLALMPFVANGTDLETSLRHGSGQNFELELRHAPAALLLPKRKGHVNLLGYSNRANMGLYRTQNGWLPRRVWHRTSPRTRLP